MRNTNKNINQFHPPVPETVIQSDSKLFHNFLLLHEGTIVATLSSAHCQGPCSERKLLGIFQVVRLFLTFSTFALNLTKLVTTYPGNTKTLNTTTSRLGSLHGLTTTCWLPELFSKRLRPSPRRCGAPPDKSALFACFAPRGSVVCKATVKSNWRNPPRPHTPPPHRGPWDSPILKTPQQNNICPYQSAFQCIAVVLCITQECESARDLSPFDGRACATGGTPPATDAPSKELQA